MAIDWNAELLDPIYEDFGVSAKLVTAPGVPLQDVTVLDLSEGVDIDQGRDISVQTLRPAAAVRASELVDKNIRPNDLLDGTITFGGVAWTIRSHKPKPAPTGEADGEIYLILERSAC